MIRLILILLVLSSCSGLRVVCRDGDELLCKTDNECRVVQKRALHCGGGIQDQLY
jgi:hypothetical protein